MKGNSKMNIAVFASGSGSNAENIYRYFSDQEEICIRKVFTNNPDAGVIKRFHGTPVEVLVFDREEFKNETFLAKLVGIDFIVLAGFLWLVPPYLIQRFKDRIINIHPSLLPKYGGKGMYGMHVHEAVVKNNERFSGITIHLVNEEYDKGKILCQKQVTVDASDTALALANKIHTLEYEWFPKIIEQHIKKTSTC